MKITELCREEIITLLKEHDSINSILKSLSVNSNGSGAYKTFKNHCKRLNIDLNEFKTITKYANLFNTRIPIEEILVEDSTYQNISRLKKRLVSEGLMAYSCVKCGNTGEWFGEPIVLQLDHINGNNTDHRLDNLRFLCPNCHTQTKTFAARNIKSESKTTPKRKVNNRPSIDIIIRKVVNNGYSATGREYNVSDNTIRNWIKKEGYNPKTLEKE